MQDYDDQGRYRFSPFYEPPEADSVSEAQDTSRRAASRGESARCTERNSARYERNAAGALAEQRLRRERKQREFEDFCHREGRR